MKELAASIEAEGGGGPVGWSKRASLDLLFYLGRHIDSVPPEKIKAYIEEDPRSLVIVWEDNLPGVPAETIEVTREVLTGRLKKQGVVVLGAAVEKDGGGKGQREDGGEQEHSGAGRE